MDNNGEMGGIFLPFAGRLEDLPQRIEKGKKEAEIRKISVKLGIAFLSPLEKVKEAVEGMAAPKVLGAEKVVLKLLEEKRAILQKIEKCGDLVGNPYLALRTLLEEDKRERPALISLISAEATVRYALPDAVLSGKEEVIRELYTNMTDTMAFIETLTNVTIRTLEEGEEKLERAIKDIGEGALQKLVRTSALSLKAGLSFNKELLETELRPVIKELAAHVFFTEAVETISGKGAKEVKNEERVIKVNEILHLLRKGYNGIVADPEAVRDVMKVITYFMEN